VIDRHPQNPSIPVDQRLKIVRRQPDVIELWVDDYFSIQHGWALSYSGMWLFGSRSDLCLHAAPPRDESQVLAIKKL
jgi:hypothetical protein